MRVVVTVLAFWVGIFFHAVLPTQEEKERNQLITKCEQSLRRDQKCKLVAIPATGDN